MDKIHVSIVEFGNSLMGIWSTSIFNFFNSDLMLILNLNFCKCFWTRFGMNTILSTYREIQYENCVLFDWEFWSTNLPPIFIVYVKKIDVLISWLLSFPLMIIVIMLLLGILNKIEAKLGYEPNLEFLVNQLTRFCLILQVSAQIFHILKSY